MQDVSPDGLLQLLQGCPELRVLRYVCRGGAASLDSSSMRQLAAAVPLLCQLDIRCHERLDNAALHALVDCVHLQEVSRAAGNSCCPSAARACLSPACRADFDSTRCLCCHCLQLRLLFSDKITTAGLRVLLRQLPQLHVVVARCKRVVLAELGRWRHRVTDTPLTV